MQIAFQALAASLVVGLGARLFLLSKRTGEAPEFWLGGFFGIVGLSIILSPLGGQMNGSTLGRVLITAGQAATTIGLICLIRFNWQVFRPDSTIARNFALLCGGLDLGCFLYAAWVGFGVALQSSFGPLFIVSRLLIIGWACYECTTHAVRMRKRLALGLADPVVANRFVLWAIWTGILTAMPVVVLIARVSGALVFATDGGGMTASTRIMFASIAGGALVAAVAVALAFFPPARYQAWVRGEARAA